MSLYISLLVLASMAFVLNNHLVSECQSVQIATAEFEGVPMNLKRSFCNTYGGCRSKKTTIVPPVYSDSASAPAATGGQQHERRRLANSIDRSDQSSSRRDTSSALVAEILSDLVEYLQADEKYRQGKYVVMVPKHYDGIVARSSDPGASNDDRDEQAPEMQELQVSRIFGRARNE